MSKQIFGVDVNFFKNIKNLFKETNIEEFEFEEGENIYIRVSRKKENLNIQAQPVTVLPTQAQVSPVPVVNNKVETPVKKENETTKPTTDIYNDETKYHKIKSPVIGTYYEAPSPGSPPFVKLGDVVSPDTTVCIIEAMKIMNEIKADAKGKIVQVLKTNGASVSANEVLFVVEKM